MDFMKVFDQTVREIKREVNLKVLKVPEIEQKVLDATDDEPWGPHGSALSEIAHATKKFSECQMIMNVLWTRLTEGSARWRHAYKALTVIEYLIANGSERAVDDILEHSSQISVLSKFEYVEPNGKDTGINVRKKVETIMNLVNDKDKIKAVRDKAASNRDKYVGLSSSGITFKSSSTSSQSSYSNYNSSDRYGTLSGTREESSFKDSYTKEDSSKERKKSTDSTSRIKKGIRNQDLSSKATAKSSSVNDSNDDDFDDFDPRGSNKSGTTTNDNNASTKAEVDFFGPNLMDDFLDATPAPAQQSNPIEIEEKSDDLFADADFQSAPPPPKPQDPIDLFGSISSPPDLFSTSEPTSNPKNPINSNNSKPADPFDPFAAVPMTNTFTSDPFGDFTSTTNTNKSSSQTETLNSLNSLAQETLNPNSDDGFGTFTSAGSTNTASGIGGGIGKSGGVSNKSGFQVKSGIWADSLSKGLIDLNITAPKKVNLADIGIVGGLDDANNEKDIFSSYYMGSTGGSSNLSGFGQNQFGQNQFGQNQFGGFK
ncbi:hypothetical protein LUZ60_000459 [Juncus effusus]|nr:hypothetical protein LUZ60_000459 [Juncus effusus]